MTRKPLRIGIGGPVGSGKTALVDALCKLMRNQYRLGVITNDIFTREDMEFLVRSEALPADRIIGVQTGGCPHTAIREDASMNFEAIDEMGLRHPDLDLVFLESGGDNLAASFSPELVDASIYVIDVSGGDKIPRKGGPGVTRSDLLVINKIDLAPFVGASLDVMARDSKLMRGHRPFFFTNMKSGDGLQDVVTWIRRDVLYEKLDCREAAVIGRQARFELVCELRGGHTVVTHAYAEPPLRIGRTLDVDGAVYCILVCSAPGVFAGDTLQQRVRVGKGARVLLTSQSALQVHPGESVLPAVVRHEYVVEDGGELHCQWDAVIPFAGARLSQRFDIQIASGSRFYWSDALMSGRVRRDEHWQFESLAHELRVGVDGMLRYLERYTLEPVACPLATPWRAGDGRYLGTGIVHHDAATAEEAERLHRSIDAHEGLTAAVDLVEPRLMVGRFLAGSGTAFARARAEFRTGLLDRIFQTPHLVFRR